MPTPVIGQRGRQAARWREVAKEIGRDIVGDLSDDDVLRDAARSVLERLGDNPEAMPEFRAIAENGAKAK